MKLNIDQRRDLLSSLGFNPNDVDIWTNKWSSLRGRAIDKKNCLSFSQYIELARDAGIDYYQIGRSIESYHMSRLGDTGDYIFGNCRFITHKENLAEKIANGGAKAVGIKVSGVKRPGTSKILGGRNKKEYEYIMEHSNIMSKNFELVSPDGEIHRGKNLKEFCLSNGLAQSSMSKVCRGDGLIYRKGWSGRYV